MNTKIFILSCLLCIAVTFQAKSAAVGTIDVGVQGGSAWVYVDGKKVSTTPVLGHALNVGVHKVQLKDDGGKILKTWEVKVTPGSHKKLLYKPPK